MHVCKSNCQSDYYFCASLFIVRVIKEKKKIYIKQVNNNNNYIYIYRERERDYVGNMKKW